MTMLARWEHSPSWVGLRLKVLEQTEHQVLLAQRGHGQLGKHIPHLRKAGCHDRRGLLAAVQLYEGWADVSAFIDEAHFVAWLNRPTMEPVYTTADDLLRMPCDHVGHAADVETASAMLGRQARYDWHCYVPA